MGNEKKIIGSAFGHGAKIYTTALGPKFLKDTYNIMEYIGPEFLWDSIVELKNVCEHYDQETGHNCDAVYSHNVKLCKKIQNFVSKNPKALPVVIGGDHSCGIGTWSGITSVLQMESKFGLIWIDAHMDAHTLKTSLSKSYHGMPLSILLGKPSNKFSKIGSPNRKIHPKNLVLIGVRSFEEGEESLLKEEGVRIFYMDEVQKDGIQNVLQEATQIVNTDTHGFGISIDLDSFDPSEAPGVGSPEPGGMKFAEIKPSLKRIFSHNNLKCIEITEFNPTLDVDNKTAQIILEILQQMKSVR